MNHSDVHHLALPTKRNGSLIREPPSIILVVDVFSSLAWLPIFPRPPVKAWDAINNFVWNTSVSQYDSHNSMTKVCLVDMGVSLNGGTPNLHPKMVIFCSKTHGSWVPPFQETPIATTHFTQLHDHSRQVPVVAVATNHQAMRRRCSLGSLSVSWERDGKGPSNFYIATD